MSSKSDHSLLGNGGVAVVTQRYLTCAGSALTIILAVGLNFLSVLDFS